MDALKSLFTPEKLTSGRRALVERREGHGLFILALPRGGFNVDREIPSFLLKYAHHANLERNMGEVIQFVSRSERERIRLIREARARYESVFPSASVVNDQQRGAATVRAVGNVDVRDGR